MEIILLVIYTFVVWTMGAVAGWKAREEHAKKVTEKFIEYLQESGQQQVDENVIQINIEKHNNVFYVYDKETNEFMAQGSSKDEVETNLKKRYPGKSFGCAESVLSQTGFYS
jgi:Na+-transporting methylmalonyl-CoA/oxaloacetate decarboxylase gamma subunit